MYFSARAVGRISYGHLGRTNSCFIRIDLRYVPFQIFLGLPLFFQDNSKTFQFSEIQLDKSRAKYDLCKTVISLTGWLMLRTVFLTMLYYLKLLTLLSHNLLNFGNIKILLDEDIEASACARNSTTSVLVTRLPAEAGDGQFACAHGERRRRRSHDARPPRLK